VFEVMLRLRIAGPVLVEVGGFAIGGGGFVGNVSQGIVVELEAPSRRLPYVAFGTAAAGGCGEGEAGLGCGGIVYGYARVGLQWQSSRKRGSTDLLTLDGGAWLGGTNNDDRGFRPFLIPMVGVGLYFGRER
jgi:hypothetical protein